ncbi:DUF6531 domain-containing protein [Streptomyces huasconensis]|uniref:DUF6531 domain-containing protein n=1 Tax=Streptomyces huasconensis TaxID=1854574 RepID=A0ABV3LP43_9ACTN
MGGHRPKDWHVLDLERDPTPGDPDRVRKLAKDLHDFSDDVGKVLRDIKGMAGEDAILRWAGKTADAFTEKFEKAPEKLKKLKKSYGMAGDALAAYWPELERAQALADKALVKGREAQADLSSAKSRLSSADSWVEKAGKEADKYKDGGSKSKDVPKPDEDKVRAATRNAASAEKAQKSAQGDVDAAKSALEAAKKMAADARKMREEAAGTAKRKIDEASDAGIRNRKWWEEIGDWVSDNWDTIVEICKVVVAVVGIIAIIIGGPILAAIVIVAGAIVLADTLNKYRKGQAGLMDVAFAALDCVPGGKGITTAAKLGKGLKGMAKGLRHGGAKGLRQGAKDLFGKSKPYKGRCRGGDPIDMVTGEMLMTDADLELPGILPLVVRRTHISSYRWGRWFGESWVSTLDQRLELDDQGAVFAAEDGMLLTYPVPEAGAEVMPLAGPQWPLTWDGSPEGEICVVDPETGDTRHFAPTSAALRQDMEGQAFTLPLMAISERNGHRIDFEYDAAGAPVAIRHSGGYHVAVDTDGARVTALRLLTTGEATASTTVRRYGYGPEGHLESIYNSAPRPYRLTYDRHARITSWTDRNGGWYRYSYDDRHRVTAGVGADGYLSCELAYDDENRVNTYTNSLGGRTTYRYNERLQLTSMTDPLGHTTHREWDERNRLTAWTDPLGRTTRQVFDDRGNLREVTRPDGATTRADYDDLGLPVLIVEPDGATWRYAYDGKGNRLSAVDPADAVTTYAYDSAGRPLAVTNALGEVRRMETDLAGLPVSMTDPLGQVTTARRDAFGRVVAVSDALRRTDRFGWTPEGKPAWRTYPDGSREAWEWDGEGNLVGHTARNGAVTSYTFTHFHQPASRSTPDGRRYDFRYDTEVNLTSVVGADGRTWDYEYDEAGRLVGECDFNDRVLSYFHDAAGQLSSWTKGTGERVTLSRDVLGRPVEFRSDDDVSTYTYDLGGSLLRAANRDTTVERTYDAAGRTIAETVNGRTTTYAYDALGRRTSRRTPTGIESTWTYDAMSRPETLWAAGHEVRFTFDAAHRETARTLGGDVTLTQSWDGNGRLAAQSLSRWEDGPDAGQRLLQQREYTYAADGTLRGIDELAGGSRRFGVDSTGRLTAVHAQGWAERYAYDRAGNLVRAETPATEEGGEEREFSGTLLGRAGRTRYRYDGHGRLIRAVRRLLNGQKRVSTYTWNSDDRLVGVVTPDGMRWRYQYDPDGRRTKKQRLAEDGGVLAETSFVWDGTRLCEQIDSDGRVTTWDYEPGTYRPLAQVVADRTGGDEETDARFFAIVTDLVGAPAELVSAEGRIAWRRRFLAWGGAVHTRADDPTEARAGGPGTDDDWDVECPLRFPGQYADAETGWNYNYFRYYDPQTARYASPDPLGLAPDPNNYAYVANPTIFFDPLGLIRVRGAGGRWERDANSPPQAHSRDTEYPGSYRQSTHDAMAAQWTDEGIAQGGTPMRPTGRVDSHGQPIMERIPRSELTWRNSAGEHIPSSQLTYEHLHPVVDHWNEIGYRSDRATRNDFYHDPANMEPMTRSENSRGGALMDATYRQDVDPTTYSCS